MQTPLLVAVTAHRDILPAEVPGVRDSIRAFFTDLIEAYPEIPVQLVSPLAEGGGRLAAKVALELGMELIIPLPMPRELYREDFETASSRQEFDELCAKGTVLDGKILEGTSLEEVQRPGPARTRQYAQLGVFLSSHCHILMAIWDGIELDLLGGTSQVVRYHLTGAMPGFAGGPLSSQRSLAGNENDLVYHIACSRARSPGVTATGLQPGDSGFYTASSYREMTPSMPDSARRMFTQMQIFNEDLQKTSDSALGESLLAAGSIQFDDAAVATNNYFMKVNELAKIYQSRVHFSLRAIYALAALLGVSFIAYSDFENMQFMIWLFLLFFSCGVAVYLVAKRQDWHRKYLDYRALAEGLRVQFYWHVAGVEEESGTAFVHDNFLQKQDIEVGWIRNVMRFISLSTPMPTSKSTSSGLDYVIENWIGKVGPEGVGQLAYFDRTALRRTRTHQLTRSLGLACMWLGISIALVLATSGHLLSNSIQTFLLALMGIFPLMAAVREAYAHKRADKELIKQYRFMHRLFGNARDRIDHAASSAEKRAILRALGTAALDEHAEWILMHRERPLEHSKL